MKFWYLRTFYLIDHIMTTFIEFQVAILCTFLITLYSSCLASSNLHNYRPRLNKCYPFFDYVGSSTVTGLSIEKLKKENDNELRLIMSGKHILWKWLKHWKKIIFGTKNLKNCFCQDAYSESSKKFKMKFSAKIVNRC